ncbi:MAG: hypothetical protein DVB27_10835 [Verrucomicrobia bacterium]|nr:MAG: hypothetical protein DVB27_10835 [Verrucomicrobiota bacterium]
MLRVTPVLSSLLAASALAQGPPLPPDPTIPPPPSTPVPAPAPAPAPVPALPRVAVGSDTVRLQITELKGALDFYERLTKKRLVYDSQIAGPTPIVINVAGEIPREEAIRIIEISLLLNGITLVPVERSTIVKVIAAGKNPRSAAIPIISDELALPDGEHVVTFLAKLQYADPTELTQLLGTFVVQSPGQYTNLTALPKSQSILITENTAVIRGLLRIIKEVDVRPADVVSEFIPLERADAKDVLEKLTAIFEKQPAAGGAGGAAGGPAPRGVQVPRPVATTPDGTPLPPGTTAEVTAPNTVEIRAGSLSEDSIISGKIKLTADVRSNRIHVVTRPTNMTFVRKLIAEFDASVKFGEPVTRPLKFVRVEEVLDVVVKSITEPGAKEDTGTTAGGTARPGTPGGATNNNNRGLGGGGSAFGNTGGNNGGGGGGGNVGGEELATTTVDTTPIARIVGTTKIIADVNANAVIVIGNADARAKVFKLLDQLDKRIPQVMLHAVIGELNIGGKVQFGVDYILRNAGLGLTPIVVNPGTVTTTPGTTTGTTTGTTVTGTGTTPGQTSTNLVGFNGSNQPVLDLNNLLKQDTVRQIAAAGASGLTGYFTAGNSLTAVVTALENTNRFTVVNRPSVFTKNNKKAIIASGQEIAVPQNIQSSINSTNVGNAGVVTNSSVQYKNVTLQLEVVPLINSDKEVSLDILQRNNEVSGSTRIDNNDIPTIATRYVRTSVTVPNNATLVLGGLIKSSVNNAKTGIPILSSIPLLGALFSTTTKEKVRTELVILIRPEVTWAPPDAIDLREREMEYLNIPPDLESTLFPDVKAKKATPEVMLRKPAAPLREKGPAPKKRS